MLTNRVRAQAMREAAKLLLKYGKAEGVPVDPKTGRMCYWGAVNLAVISKVGSFSHAEWMCLHALTRQVMAELHPDLPERYPRWGSSFSEVRFNDLRSTTAADMAKVALAVAEKLEVEPESEPEEHEQLKQKIHQHLFPRNEYADALRQEQDDIFFKKVEEALKIAALAYQVPKALIVSSVA